MTPLPVCDVHGHVLTPVAGGDGQTYELPHVEGPTGAQGPPGDYWASGVQDKPVALKFDAGKPRLELLPPEFLTGVAKVLTFGAQKYSAGNWASGDGFEWSRLYGALLRHITAWANGEDIDPESGLSHLYHAGCMLAFLAAHMERGLGVDDRKQIGVQP